MCQNRNLSVKGVVIFQKPETMPVFAALSVKGRKNPLYNYFSIFGVSILLWATIESIYF
jgi:hypothetical protein